MRSGWLVGRWPGTRQATRLVNGSALLVQGPNGLAKNPALVVQREAETSFAHYGARFGLTPERPQSAEDRLCGRWGQGPGCRAAPLVAGPPRVPRVPARHAFVEDRRRLVVATGGEGVIRETTVYTDSDTPVPVGSQATVWPGTPYERTARVITTSCLGIPGRGRTWRSRSPSTVSGRRILSTLIFDPRQNVLQFEVLDQRSTELVE